MIYDADKGDRGKVFSNGVEVDRKIVKVDTETGECQYIEYPVTIIDGQLEKRTIHLENVTFHPL